MTFIHGLKEFPTMAIESTYKIEVIRLDDKELYIKEYFARKKVFVPSNYAIGTRVVTA